jgi:DNA-binding MarR family transcriptional regulator
MNQDKVKSVGFLISYLTRQAHRYFESEFVKHNLNRGSIFILKRLYESDGIRQQDLSSSLHFDKANITRIIRKLQELGFVQKLPDKEDKRASRIFLTDKAREFQSTFADIFHGWSRVILSGFTPKEEQNIWLYLHKMSTNTEQYFKEMK